MARARRACVVLAWTACSLLATQGAAAQRQVGGVIDMSLDGLFELPAYCADSQYGGRYDPGNFTPSQARWVSLMGSTGFHHIHHYCMALDSAKKARNPLLSPQERRAFFSSAMKDGTYVLERVSPDFVLLPEIYLRMGQFSLGRGDVGGALDYFEKSRRSKRDYWPAYVEAAKANLGLGWRQQAEEVLKAGLEVMPDEPQLKRALEQLNAVPAAAKRAGSK